MGACLWSYVFLAQKPAVGTFLFTSTNPFVSDRLSAFVLMAKYSQNQSCGHTCPWGSGDDHLPPDAFTAAAMRAARRRESKEVKDVNEPKGVKGMKGMQFLQNPYGESLTNESVLSSS